MRNKVLAIIAAIIAPWALLSYAAYKHATLSNGCCGEQCKCKNK